TRLLYGERLRRAGRRSDARIQLRGALDAFDQLGAEPWAARSAQELRASGGTVRTDPAAREELTPQELQVALVVAEGATTREAAARLFLSPKTSSSTSAGRSASSECTPGRSWCRRSLRRRGPHDVHRDPEDAGGRQPVHPIRFGVRRPA